MSKKLKREFRETRLTPQEAAADRDTRAKIAAEFPPSSATTKHQSSPLSELLKQSIRDSGKSVEAIANESGVSAVLIVSFLSGERDIHLATADTLARSLGIAVVTD